MALQAIVILVLGLGFLVLGLGFIWWARRAGELALASQSWPTAMARITANSIEHWETDESETFIAKVSYTYTVDGKSYVGSRISAHGKYLSSHALARA